MKITVYIINVKFLHEKKQSEEKQNIQANAAILDAETCAPNYKLNRI